MSHDLQRRMDGSGIRRGTRSPGGIIYPWTGFSPVCALDARLGTQTETGVRTWSDQSGNGNHVEQTDTAKQPALSTFNGRPALDFDGVDDFLRTASFSGMINENNTIFVVAHFDIASGNMGLVDLSEVVGLTNRYVSFFHNSTNLYYRCGGVKTTLYSFSDTTSSFVFEGVNDDAGNAEILENGVSQDTDATASGFADPTILVVGDTEDGGNKMNGMIQSVLIFDTNLSSADRSVIRGRLGSVWGITVS